MGESIDNGGDIGELELEQLQCMKVREAVPEEVTCD